jgi:hypothetical protein
MPQARLTPARVSQEVQDELLRGLNRQANFKVSVEDAAAEAPKAAYSPSTA